MDARELLRLPNLLSLSRVPLAAALWWHPEHPAFLLALMALAALTDVLDGWTARHGWGGNTEVGAWLDPLCDKVFVVSAVVAVLVAWSPPVSLALLVLTRDLLQVPLLLAFRALTAGRRVTLSYHAAWTGKLTTVGQFACLGAILLAPSLAAPLAAATAVLGVAAVGVLTRRGLRAWRAAPARTPLGHAC